MVHKSIEDQRLSHTLSAGFEKSKWRRESNHTAYMDCSILPSGILTISFRKRVFRILEHESSEKLIGLTRSTEYRSSPTFGDFRFWSVCIFMHLVNLKASPEDRKRFSKATSSVKWCGIVR